MIARDWLWGADSAALALVLVAGFGDWRRHRRRDLDAHGWMPWRGLQAAGFFALLILTALALAG